jgi:hypothetical protein
LSATSLGSCTNRGLSAAPHARATRAPPCIGRRAAPARPPLRRPDDVRVEHGDEALEIALGDGLREGPHGTTVLVARGREARALALDVAAGARGELSHRLGVRPTTSATSPNGTSNTSCSPRAQRRYPDGGGQRGIDLGVRRRIGVGDVVRPGRDAVAAAMAVGVVQPEGRAVRGGAPPRSALGTWVSRLTTASAPSNARGSEAASNTSASTARAPRLSKRPRPPAERVTPVPRCPAAISSRTARRPTTPVDPATTISFMPG